VGTDEIATFGSPTVKGALDKSVRVTRFPTQAARTKLEMRISLRQLAKEIRRTMADKKSDLPWWKLGTFGDKRTEKKCLRSNSNLLSITGVEADYDAGGMTLAEAQHRLREANIAAIVYTTPSHTEHAPRWRILAPFAEEHSPEMRDRLMARLNGILGGVLDGASFTLSQSYYAGNVRGKPPISILLIEGRFLDQADDLDAHALAKGVRRIDNTVEHTRDESGSGYGDRFMIERRIEGMSCDEAIEAIMEDENPAGEWARRVDNRQLLRTWNHAGQVAKRRREELMELFLNEDVINTAASGSQALRLRFLSPGECADAPTRGYVIKGLLAPGDVGCIFGPPGVGKSLISPYLGYRVALGEAAFALRIRQGDVFYVAAEDPHGMRGRVTALKMIYGDASGFTLVEGVSDLLSDPSPDLIALCNAVADRRPLLIIIDTLAMSFPGLEENSAEGMGRVVSVARRLTEHGAAVLLVHHDTKAEGATPRGHSLLNGALDMALQLTKRDKPGVIRGRLTKNRNGTCDLDIAFRIDTRDLGTDEDGDAIIVALAKELPSGTTSPAKKLSPSGQAALSVLHDMTECQHRGVQLKEWWKKCVEGRKVSAAEKPESRDKAVRRAVNELALSDRIRIRDEYVFLPNASLDSEEFTDEDVPGS
jgi:hypothetical protein